MTQASYALYTMDNSPYSDKIRALLRYKKLPFVEHTENLETRFSVLQARTGKTMVPVVITPDDEALNDSTAIAALLEKRHPAPAARWEDASMDAVAMLLEDYADEWLVRIMLASRWYHAADAAQNAAIIATGMTHGLFGIDFQRAAKDFPPGIISSVPKMGATPENAEGWYAMVPRILGAMAVVLERTAFLTGSRPHLCDFAFYGMLNQIRRDPTGYGWITAGPGAVLKWLDRLETACKEGGAESGGESLADASVLAPLVREAAQTYFRMSTANARAVDAGTRDAVRVTLAGGFAFEAPPAKYNRKIYEANVALIRGAPLPAPLAPLLTAELG
ncbi:MAG TPA: glutathione S-transferase family protein [Candidatus Binatia bacterium]|nr:glutathione S-transferase family protein [Candidatus Binatia bacterium]